MDVIIYSIVVIAIVVVIDIVILLQGFLNSTPITLDGTAVQSRFGQSIVGLGDINGDDFQG